MLEEAETSVRFGGILGEGALRSLSGSWANGELTTSRCDLSHFGAVLTVFFPEPPVLSPQMQPVCVLHFKPTPLPHVCTEAAARQPLPASRPYQKRSPEKAFPQEFVSHCKHIHVDYRNPHNTVF